MLVSQFIKSGILWQAKFYAQSSPFEFLLMTEQILHSSKTTKNNIEADPHI